MNYIINQVIPWIPFNQRLNKLNIHINTFWPSLIKEGIGENIL